LILISGLGILICAMISRSAWSRRIVERSWCGRCS
jgi:hypothetical protein